MAHGHGIVSQSLTVDTLALGTLGSRSAIVLNTQFSNPKTVFLMKRFRYFLQLVGRTIGDDGPILIGMARGDATTSEINAAMVERNTNGPEDITSMLDQDTAWVVYQNSVLPIIIQGDGTHGQPTTSVWLSPGGRKGIPLLEDAGMQIFAYNAGSAALSTGSTVNGLVFMQGVWLRG